MLSPLVLPSAPKPPTSTLSFCPLSTLRRSLAHSALMLSPLATPSSLDSSPSPTFPTTSSNFISGRASYQAFKSTRSRVIRIFNLPPNSTAVLASLFPNPHLAQDVNPNTTPAPMTMWTLRDDFEGTGGFRLSREESSVWAVFRSHEEACAALVSCTNNYSMPVSVSVDTALEVDLEPFRKLRKVEFGGSSGFGPKRLPPPPQNQLQSMPSLDSLRISSSPSPGSGQSLRGSISVSDLRFASNDHGNYLAIAGGGAGAGGYTLSSNPPNPKTSFRLGDWICASASCAAHNFGRNTVCIGCSTPRPINGHGHGHSHPVTNLPRPPHPQLHVQLPPPMHLNSNNNNSPSSPRFISVPPLPSPSSMFPPPSPHAYSPSPLSPLSPMSHMNPNLNAIQSPSMNTKPLQPAHPILTPSGRALSVGGKVQNVSSDPLAPCILYWPDNESFPEQGQIRPSGMVNGTQPPILNTGNRGPIEHQPGDWVCQKCDYLNWRRRKVCQTCYPYAEGNGDSISAAVQAERVALLSAVLSAHAQSQSQRPPLPHLQSPHNMLPSPTSYNPHPHSPAGFSPRSNTFGEFSPARHPLQIPHIPMRNSRSDVDLKGQWGSYQAVNDTRFPSSPTDFYINSPPIYETSGQRQSTPPSPLSVNSLRPSAHEMTPVPGALLPSFLQDLAPPSLSPTSTSSAEFSFEEYDEDPSSPIYSTSGEFYAHDHARSGTHSSSSGSSSSLNLGPSVSGLSSIWKLDGEESRAWPKVGLPSPKDLSTRNRFESKR